MASKAQINAAAVVSTLEGKSRGIFHGNELESSSLSAINRRVRLLEATHSIHSPPPNLDPTWESLAWRICRLYKKRSQFPSYHTPCNKIFSSLLPDDADVSMETIRTICMELGPGHLAAYALPFPEKCVDEDETLDNVRQRLFYVAGKHDIDINKVPVTRMEIYAELVELSIKLEAKSPMLPGLSTGTVPNIVNINPQNRSYPNIINVGPKKKRCSRCGRKDKYNVSDSDSDSDSDDSSIASKKTSRFGWLRKLFCLRPKDKVDDDTASITTKTTSTLYD
ncbi:hypothetical protein B0T10DRAFT_184429 [Thelonectria olida]|uniref:Uncharacterized protein n=1 Tax=Thelonectria olida TaxID=1576542 RepID=A0A9P8WD07_9HYPO|nr:hypothetical protein B0T10DRAFT_184429 [Thelonectria olida]